MKHAFIATVALLLSTIQGITQSYLPLSGGTMTGNINMSSGTQIQSPYYGFVYGAATPANSNNVAMFANTTTTTVDHVGWINGWRFVPTNTSSYPSPVVTFSPAGAVAIGSTTSGLPAGGIALTLRGPNTPAGGSGFQDISYSFNTAGSARIRAYRGGSWDTYLQFLVNGVNQGSDAPTVAMHIDQTANVGIGTTAPAARLDVAGSLYAGAGSVNGNTTKLFIRNPATNAKTWAISSGLNNVNEVDFGIYNWTDKGVPAGSPQIPLPSLVIASGGNVGIGTAAPGGTLHLKPQVAGGNCDLVLETNSGNAKWDLVADNNTLTAGLYDILSGKFPFGVSKGAPSYSLFVGATGNVLIGKNTQTNASYILDVNGVARANKIVVNTTGADYVFDSSYNLKPLADVETYIAKNKHLPDIAPAANMQKEGLDLGGNQTKLLQKIEELTLYLIEQKKQIDTLQREVTDLKKHK